MGHTGIFPQRVRPNADARIVWARVRAYQPSPWAMWRRPAGTSYADDSKRRPSPALASRPGHLVAEARLVASEIAQRQFRPPGHVPCAVPGPAQSPPTEG